MAKEAVTFEHVEELARKRGIEVWLIARQAGVVPVGYAQPILAQPKDAAADVCDCGTSP